MSARAAVFRVSVDSVLPTTSPVDPVGVEMLCACLVYPNVDVDVDSARGTDPAGPFPLVKKRHTFSVIVGVICKPVLDAANIDFEHYMRGGMSRSLAPPRAEPRGGGGGGGRVIGKRG